MCFLTAWQISYNTAPLKYLFIYLPADRHLGWVRVELDKPLLEKKIIRDISHFWRTSARWKGWHWKCYFSWKYSFYHIYTLANQCHWSALWQILCVHRNHRRTFEKKNCVLSCLFLPTCTRHQFPRGHVQRELLFCKRTLPKICHLRNQWHQPTLYSNIDILLDNDMVKVQA